MNGTMDLVEHHKWVDWTRFHLLFIPFLIQGWNSWYRYRCDYNETIIKQMADAIASTPLAAAGYQYGIFQYLYLFNLDHFFIASL